MILKKRDYNSNLVDIASNNNTMISSHRELYKLNQEKRKKL